MTNQDDVVINIGANTAQALKAIKDLEDANTTMAKSLGGHFQKATQLISSDIKKVGTSITRVGSEKKGFKNVTTDIMQATTVIKTAKNRFKEFTEIIINQNGQFKRGRATLKDVTSKYTKVSKVIKKTGSVMSRATKLTATLTTKIKAYQNQLKHGAKNQEQLKRRIKSYNKALRKTTAMTQKTSNATKSFKDNVTFLGKRALTVIPIWLALRAVMMGFLRVLQTSLKFLIDWEYQMAQIKMVGKDSAESIENLSDSMLHLATSLGIANSAMGESAKLFIQQGRSASELIPLLDATAKLSLLTGNTMVQSVEDLTAILKAYSLNANSAINVIDMITNTMLNNAITAQDLAKAYKQVASTASVMGVSLSALTGYITAIKAETRDAGGKIGLALRTMFTRITTVSAEALQQLTGIPLFLDEFGKKTKMVTGTFRDLEKSLMDISFWFTTATNAQQAQVAKLMGGVRRTNQAIVLFKNFNQVIKAQTDALLGLGKADKAIAELTKTNKLEVQSMANNWSELVDVVGNTDIIVGAVRFLKVQFQGLGAILDQDRALFVGLKDELKKFGQEAQRNVQFAKNFTEILALTGNLADQMNLAKTTNQFDLIQDRIQIIVEQIQAFDRLHPEININLDPTLDARGINKQLESQKDKFIDMQVKAQIDFDRTQIQDEFISIGRELQSIFKMSPGQKITTILTGRNLNIEAYKEIEKIVDNISKGELITQNDLRKVEQWAQKLSFAETESVGIKRKFTSLADAQKKLVGLSGKELEIRKQITKQVEREVEKKRTSQQVEEALFQSELQSIRNNKTKEELLKAQLKILERKEQLLTDPLEKRLKTIRKELETIRATEEQNIIKSIVNDQIERLKLAGALNSTIIKRRILLDKEFSISRMFSENLQRELELEREINKEKRLKTDLSSDAIKLFRIAQTEGRDIATKISNVLSKEVDFSTFVRLGGKALDVFKRDFADIFEHEQAKAFYKGEVVPDISGLRGGIRIELPVEDSEIVGRSTTRLIDALSALRQAFTQYEAKTNLTPNQVKATTGSQISTQQNTLIAKVTTPVNVNIDVSNLDELATQVENKLVKNIPIVGSKAYEAIKTVVFDV